jgi:hypothetical protein
MLGLPADKVHGIWIPGPGSYGRSDVGINPDGFPRLPVDQESSSDARPGCALRFIEKGCSHSRLPVTSLGSII